MGNLTRATELWHSGKRSQAESEITAVLEALPDDAAALRFLAEIYAATNRSQQAIPLWRRLSTIKPGDAGVLRQLAQILITQGALGDAIDLLRKSIELEPTNPRAYNNLGLAQLRGGDAAAAAASLQQALEISPTYALAHLNLGLAHGALNRVADARACYERALQIDPHLTDARQRLSELLRSTDESAARSERYRALESHAINLMTANRHDAAIEVWTRLIEEGAPLGYLSGTRFHCQLHCCDWSEYAQMTRYLQAEVMRGGRVDLPFSFFVHSSSPGAQLACARIFAADRHPEHPAAPRATRARSAEPQSGRLRLAYLSSEFRDHATAYLIADLLGHHDRSRFEIFALSYGPSEPGVMRARIAASVEHFIDVSERTDAEVVELMRSLGVQIAVDLKGLSGGARTGIFARRAAPVQINFLGYPGSMGAEYIDYIVADRHVIPEQEQPHYSEKVIYLPHCYQPNDPLRPLPQVAPSRQELELPQAGFVFCCFNHLYKITPATFGLWLDLLRQLPGAVLWLLEGAPAAMRNLRARTSLSGVAPERIVFAPHVPLAQHLARYRHADLFLDTTPCNAHTTASDALWMGVPVLTLTGETFAGRVATSLLHAVDLQELCAQTLDEYAARALRLATMPDELAKLKAHLEGGRRRFAAFDAPAFRRHIETAYQEVWKRHRRGQPPRMLAIAQTSEHAANEKQDS
jgi:predicted O-linked N-acetylglucosamine transferase (SPINDLY family)